MSPFRRFTIAFAMLLFAASARAEAIFPVNGSGSGAWAYDQPAAVADGSLIHVAFIGDSTGSGQFKLYYAAVQGGANFADNNTTRSQVVTISPTVIDNGALYSDARHPQIALRASNQVIIVFQAVPAGLGNGDYRLFRALVNVANNAVTTQSVSEIVGVNGVRMSGPLSDPSFRPVTSDGSLRMAYTQTSAGLGNVYFARVGIDNTTLAAAPILLSSVAASQGIQPLPRLGLDGNNYSHVVWAANNAAGTPSGIYYAMVKTVPPGTTDALGIGATQVLYGGNRWVFPNMLVTSTSQVWVLASDEPPGSEGLAGPLGITLLNPYAVTQDGNPVNVNNASSNALFFVTVPGGSVLPANFDVYHPEIALDSQNRGSVAGYGFRGSAPLYQGSPGRYYTMGLGTSSSSTTTNAFAVMILYPVSIGTGNLSFAMQTPGDYTRPAFIHYSGKAVHFWSGPDTVVSGARNLYVTSTVDASDPSSADSGCAVAGTPPGNGGSSLPEAAALLLPALVLAVRRAARKAVGR
ncbi:MAG: hypothetical protein ACM3L8_07490 [Verrucomicrobiota bacterium]